MMAFQDESYGMKKYRTGKPINLLEIKFIQIIQQEFATLHRNFCFAYANSNFMIIDEVEETISDIRWHFTRNNKNYLLSELQE